MNKKEALIDAVKQTLFFWIVLALGFSLLMGTVFLMSYAFMSEQTWMLVVMIIILFVIIVIGMIHTAYKQNRGELK
jgi:biotin transporter BioY